MTETEQNLQLLLDFCRQSTGRLCWQILNLMRTQNAIDLQWKSDRQSDLPIYQQTASILLSG